MYNSKGKNNYTTNVNEESILIWQNILLFYKHGLIMRINH